MGINRLTGNRQKSSITAVVLAAGMSRRMGSPKQLLRIGGETILQRTLNRVRASAVDEIVLVLGFAAEDVRKEISTERVKIVRNQDYQQGMGSSLRTGLAAVDTNAQAALIVLADQPFVRAETLDRLIRCHQDSAPQIIIPMYQGFRGNPVLLDRSVFPELNALTGDVGCRAIFGSHTEKICKLAVDDAGILLDIDSPEEYQTLSQAGNVLPNEVRLHAVAMLESRGDLPVGRAELVIVGRDAVAFALVKLGRLLNFTVTVVDPFLPLAEAPDADRLLHRLELSLLPPIAERYVVVASRGQFDEEAVEQALLAESPYVALLSNKKRADEIRHTLSSKFPVEKIAGIRSPAGLDIGAESPEEIALSILAEIVSQRRQKAVGASS